jgi:hypothetical protein
MQLLLWGSPDGVDPPPRSVDDEIIPFASTVWDASSAPPRTYCLALALCTSRALYLYSGLTRPSSRSSKQLEIVKTRMTLFQMLVDTSGNVPMGY